MYQATDSKLGRSVAIKFLPEAFSHDNECVARFQREARVLASLNHPGIAHIYGVEERALAARSSANTPPAGSVLMFEGLPSLDAAMGVEAIAAGR